MRRVVLPCVAAAALLGTMRPAHTERIRTVTVTVTADSQEEGYEASRAMDGDPATIWHTEFRRRTG